MKITHRQRGSTGRLFGVDFVDGVGHTDDPKALERLRRQGHRIEAESSVLDDAAFLARVGETMRTDGPAVDDPEGDTPIGDLVDYAITNNIRPARVPELDDTQEIPAVLDDDEI